MNTPVSASSPMRAPAGKAGAGSGGRRPLGRLRVRSDLPGDVRDPVVTKIDLASQPVLAFTVYSRRRDDEALSWFVDNDISRKLLAVPGVGAVNRVGGVTREIRVALDPARLQALGATAAEISRQLRQVQTESAGGRTDVGGSEQTVRTLATVQTAREIGELQLSLSDSRSIRLKDVATVSDTIAEPRAAALLDGKPVVGFEVARSRGESEVTVGAAVHEALAELKRQQPDIELVQAFDFVTPVQEEYEGSLHLLYEGAALAVLVVWLFLRDWRATLVSAVALPMSVIPAFLGMHLLGLHGQHRDAAGAVAGGGHPGRRRHRRGREHRAPPAHGQDAVPGGDGGGRRDRAGGHRDHLHADRGVPADCLHERHRRQVLQAVRLDRGAGRVRVAGGGARC